MGTEKGRGAGVMMSILLGTGLGGAVGSFAEYFLNDFVGHAVKSRDSWEILPLFLSWLPLLNPCAHIGAALGCVLAWRRTGTDLKRRAEGPGPAHAPGRGRSLGPEGARVVRLTIGGSLVGSLLGAPMVGVYTDLLWGYYGFLLGTYVGPPVGALIVCWLALRDDRGMPAPAPGQTGRPRKCAKCGTGIAGSAAQCGSCGAAADLAVHRSGHDGDPSPAVDPSPRDGRGCLSLKIPPVLGWVMVIAFLVCLGAIATPRFGGGKLSANETSAISALRNLAAVQAQMQTSGKIDCDGDGVGEHGTFLEMTGSVPVRNGFYPGNPAGSDFSRQGNMVNPPILTPILANVDARGVVGRFGYCFLIYLPSDSKFAGFVHETGPAATPGLSGRVGVDLSETCWCAYAWPVARGTSGNRCFFVNQSGDIMQSANDVAKWSGMERPPAPDSAFLGSGITGQTAVGARGRDGDFWKVTN